MLQSKQVAAKMPLPEATSAVHAVTCVGEYVTGAALPLNSVIEMTGIPAGHVPVDFKIVTDDLDSNGTPTIQFTAGVLSGRYGENDDARTIGTEFASASTTAQAGGVLANPKFNGLLLGSSDSDRGVGIKITAAAATLIAGAKVRFILTCIPADGLMA